LRPHYPSSLQTPLSLKLHDNGQARRRIIPSQSGVSQPFLGDDIDYQHEDGYIEDK
jgi:hypothetical protein